MCSTDHRQQVVADPLQRILWLGASGEHWRLHAYILMGPHCTLLVSNAIGMRGEVLTDLWGKIAHLQMVYVCLFVKHADSLIYSNYLNLILAEG